MNKLEFTNPSRRTFLKGAAVFSASMFMPKSVLGANSKPCIAWVGFNNQGWNDLRSCSHGCDVVALCDCDEKVWGKAKRQFGKAKFYKDFRKMFEEMGDKIDAVGVGTPDHNHFAIAYTAISMGKHVFVEKPLVHSIWEARTLLDLARQKGVITQMGNQGHGFEGARLIKEWYQAGAIGEVKEVLAWTDRPRGGWGFPRHPAGGFTEYAKGQAVPGGLNWDLWLGAVNKPIKYNNTYRGRQGCWRPWWDFGCGGLGDIGCHTIDTPYWALDLGAPESVDVKMKHPGNSIHTPDGSVVTFNFPARGNKPPVKVKWYEGPEKPKTPKGHDQGISRSGGMIMVGDKGGICHSGMRPDSPRFSSKAKWEDYRKNPKKRVPKTLPRVPGIHREWSNAIKDGKKRCCSDFSYSAPLTEVILLGSLAIRTGKGFKWDAKNMKISGNDEAAKLLKVEARKGWRVQDLT